MTGSENQNNTDHKDILPESDGIFRYGEWIKRPDKETPKKINEETPIIKSSRPQSKPQQKHLGYNVSKRLKKETKSRILNFLKAWAHRNPSLMFYPSAGYQTGFILNNPDYNLFILSDNSPEKLKLNVVALWGRFLDSCGSVKIDTIMENNVVRFFTINEKKIGIFLFLDNNEVLDLIRDSGNVVSGFCGVCDGCGEGGNYECVNDSPFFSKVLDLIPADGELEVITDHSHLFLYHKFPDNNPQYVPCHSFKLNEHIYDVITTNERPLEFDRAWYFLIKKKNTPPPDLFSPDNICDAFLKGLRWKMRWGAEEEIIC